MKKLLLVAGLCSIAFEATAQDLELYQPAARQGYYLGGGLRSGAFTAHDKDLGSLGLMTGGGFNLRFGQAATDWIGFGLGLVAGGGAGGDWSGGYGGLLIDVQLMPLAEFPNLAVRGGIGIAGMGIGRNDATQEREDDPSGTFGPLYTAGVSYDWFPWWEEGESSGGFGFTIFVEGQLLSGGDLTAGAVFLGIEATYWFGLNDNKLDLTPDEAFGDS